MKEEENTVEESQPESRESIESSANVEDSYSYPISLEQGTSEDQTLERSMASPPRLPEGKKVVK